MKESQSKKSITIYLSNVDYEKVKEIVSEKRMTMAQWYRQITMLGFIEYEQQKEWESKRIVFQMGKQF